MTNEELVVLIRQGKEEYIEQLWEQIRGFIAFMAKRYLRSWPEHMRQLEDDLINESYFGLIDAIAKYDGDRQGNFVTYLRFYLNKCFNKALGYYSATEKNDGTRISIRLDEPIEGTDGLTLQETIIDPAGECGFREVEDLAFWQDVRGIIAEAIDTQLTGECHRIFRVLLDENCLISEAIRRIGVAEKDITKMRVAYQRGIRRIRRYTLHEVRNKSKAIGIFDYFGAGLRGAGYLAYKSRMFTSSTEFAAVTKADRDLNYARIEQSMKGYVTGACTKKIG